MESGTARALTLASTAGARSGYFFIALSGYISILFPALAIKFTKLSTLALLALGFLFNLTTLKMLRAEDAVAPQSPVENLFQSGLHEASGGAGVMFSPFIATRGRPTLNYELTEIQLGYMLTDVHGSYFWRGNVEVAGSGFGGPIINGQGSYVAGATAWLRYNFVPRAGHFVPFVQAGAGLTSTDDRELVGQCFNFNLNLGAGVKYFFKPNWSVNLEYRYQHISDANLTPHNLGVNADGPMLGISHYF
jgi:opacity protein-like surface antigen